MRPLFLLADSQLLFCRTAGNTFANLFRAAVERPAPKAAYVGASNGDLPAFYDLFEAAMNSMGISDCRMISSALTERDSEYIGAADIILLAGGSVEQGWHVFEQTGLAARIVERYHEGAVLVGVSAGAIQLGLCGWPETGPMAANLINTFQLVPFVVGVHEEANDWETLRSAVRAFGGAGRGLGIPAGGGVIFHGDRYVTPIRYPAHEFLLHAGELTHNLLCPESAGN